MAASYFDWSDLLENVPEAAYFSYQGQPGRSPSQKQYFKSQFEDVQKWYQGMIGQQIRGGQAPTLRFADFLADYFAPQGGAAQNWMSLSPRQRGTTTSRFSPPTRWMP